ncbi:MAG: lipid-A-disaccharide synthase [Gammaproteobacteria bacterium]|nr:lipid-A-disaccharide synthase [Gammaproteobacteria bacterium]MCF6229828.1 lipid-A-disaccharide synthase [Gammaproteobacteria bacterium]
MRIGIVAGEASGDILAAGLIQAIKQRYPQAQFEGIAGPLMIEQGCEALCDMERLSVMGIVEVLGRYRELLGIRNRVAEHFIDNPPDLFVGVDAPDFNLGLEKRLKQQGIPTAHYVSPSIWAWRQGRVKKIAQSVDMMLTLFPFEAKFYQQHRVPVTFVGHTLADRIPMIPDVVAARRALSLPENRRIVALLPGSRGSEVSRLAEPFIGTAQQCLSAEPDLHFVVPLVNQSTRALFESALAQHAADLPITLIDGHSREVMAAADVVLLASGTATLEALLLKKPMVVAYKVNWLTAFLARRLLQVESVSLPNNLAGRKVVEEYLQERAVAELLAPAVLQYLQNPHQSEAITHIFEDIHRELRNGADNRAAEALLEMIDAK